MARNKYGYPVPEPKKLAKHKHKDHYGVGGKIMGLFSSETSKEKAARYIREAEANIAKREAAEAAAKNTPKVITPESRSTSDQIRWRQKAMDDTIDAAEGKKRGGVVKSKSRGNGVAVKGHGKGKMR